MEMVEKSELTHAISIIGASNSGRHSIARALTSSLGNIVDDYFTIQEEFSKCNHIFKILPIITEYEPERRDYAMTFSNLFIYAINAEIQDEVLDLNLIAEALINSNCSGIIFVLNKIDLIPEVEREPLISIWRYKVNRVFNSELCLRYFDCTLPLYFTVVSTFELLNIVDSNFSKFPSIKLVLSNHISSLESDDKSIDTALFLIYEKYLDIYDYHTQKTLVVTGQIVSGSAKRELRLNEFVFLNSFSQTTISDIKLDVSIPLKYNPCEVTTLKFIVDNQQEKIADSIEMGDIIQVGPTKEFTSEFIFLSDTLEVECFFYDIKSVLISPGTKFMIRFKDAIREAEISKLLERSDLTFTDETLSYSISNTSSKPKFISKQSIVKMIIKLNKAIRRCKHAQHPKLSLFSTRLGTTFNLFGRILKYKS